MKKTKLIAALILIVLVTILVAQNTEPVQTQLLFWTLAMPYAFLLFVTAVVGFLVGVLVTLVTVRKKKKSRPAEMPPPEEPTKP